MKKNQQCQHNYWTILAVVNALFLYLSSLIFPENVVLGNSSIPNILAAIIVAILMVVVYILGEKIILLLKIKPDIYKIFGTQTLLNIIALWFLGRLALFLGFGISSFLVAIILGLFLTGIQYGLKTVYQEKK